MKTYGIIAVVGIAILAGGFFLFRSGSPVEPLVTPALSTSVAPVVSKTVLPSSATKPAATKAVTPVPTLAPTKAPTPVPTQAVQATPDTRCIVTILGGRYDVTTYRKVHKGGDVFVCGTDMTSAFEGQHDAEILQKVQSLKVQ